MQQIFFSLVIAVLLLVVISCSGGSNVVTPVTEPEMTLGTSRHEEQNQTHSLWGMWQFIADPEAGTLGLEVLEGLNCHLHGDGSVSEVSVRR